MEKEKSHVMDDPEYNRVREIIHDVLENSTLTPLKQVTMLAACCAEVIFEVSGRKADVAQNIAVHTAQAMAKSVAFACAMNDKLTKLKS